MKKRHLFSMSLGTQIFIGYICLLILTIGVSMGLYLRQAKLISEDTQNVNMSRELLTYQSEFEAYIKRADECSRMICNSDELQNALVEASQFITREPVESLDNALLRQLTGNSILSSVYVFDTRGNMYEADDNYTRTPAMKDVWSAPWFGTVYEQQGDYILKINSGGFFEEDEEQGDYISLIRSIMELGTDNHIGTLIVNVSLDSLRKEFEKNADEMNVVICDEYNNVAFSVGDTTGISIKQYLRDYIICGINYQTYEGEDGTVYKVCCRKFDEESWRILGVVKQNTYVEAAGQFGTIALIVLLIDAFIVLIGVWIYKNLLFKVLNPLLKSLRKIPEGKFEAIKPIKVNRELYELQFGYNQMVGQIQDLFKRVKEEQEEKRRYELDVLNAQIKPHFLYNTFDSIGALILTKRDKDAFKMVQALGKYYRISLHKGDELIPISDELKIITNYLIIQKYRYEDIISVEYDLDEQVNDYLILKLILQPFIENAIYHGLKVKEDGGVIKIKTINEDDFVLIQISDNGVGMDTVQIDEILREEAVHGQKSFGMRGTIERIRLYYKQDDLVKVESQAGMGTMISIRIPKQRLYFGGAKDETGAVKGFNR